MEAPIRETTNGQDGSASSVLAEGPLKSELKSVDITSPRMILLFLGIYTGLFLSMMDASIVASCLHTISGDFQAFGSVNWVALAYTLAECSCGSVFGRVSDIIGRKNAFVAANVIFLAFSLGCGFSQNLTQLIAFRAMQGLGGAGLFSMAMIAIPQLCPKHLDYMFGLAGVTIVGASCIGPILGGVLTQYTSWRWVFWMNGPICATSIGFLSYLWPNTQDLRPMTQRSWKSFDYTGSILFVAASVLIVSAFQNAGISTTSRFWSSALFVCPLIIGLICTVALFTWEYTMEHHFMPIFPPSLLRNRFYASGLLTTLFMGFPLFMLIFSVPLRAQLVSSKSPLQAAITLLPMLGASAMGCVIAAAVNSKRAFFFESMLTGSTSSVLGCTLLTTISDAGDDKKLLGYTTIVGLGIGLSISAATGVGTYQVFPREYAPAQGILGQARVLGGSLGISALTVLLHSRIEKLVPGPISPHLLAIFGDAEADLPDQLLNLRPKACSEAFKDGMLLSAAVSGAAVLTALLGYQRNHQDPKKQRLDLVRSEALESQAAKDAGGE